MAVGSALTDLTHHRDVLISCILSCSSADETARQKYEEFKQLCNRQRSEAAAAVSEALQESAAIQVQSYHADYCFLSFFNCKYALSDVSKLSHIVQNNPLLRRSSLTQFLCLFLSSTGRLSQQI